MTKKKRKRNECQHGRSKSHCKDCNPEYYKRQQELKKCEHNRNKYICQLCSPEGYEKSKQSRKCEHGVSSYNCRVCNPENFRRKQISLIKTRFGLSEEAYLKLFEDQDNKCNICLEVVQPFVTTSVVDHDHSMEYATRRCLPDAVRGILCKQCNSGIAYLKENKGNFERAIKHLSREQ